MMDRSQTDRGIPRETSSNDTGLSLPASNLDLDLAVEKGLEITSSVAHDILDLIESGKLRDEQVELKGLIRTKTNADRISHQLFCERLGREFPQCKILSEDSRASGQVVTGAVPEGAAHFVLDPIDGTIHLKERDGQWLLNLGVVVDGVGKIGIVAAPAKNRVYLGVAGRPSIVMNLDGSERQEVMNRNSPDSKIFGICHPLDLGNNEELHQKCHSIARENGATETKEFGSAYSYLMVAEGQLDVFVNSGGNFHWDTVAQQVVLEGAGCNLAPIDWSTDTLNLTTALPARYDLSFCKDDGHIAARRDLEVMVNPELRAIWRPVFD